MKLIVRPRWRVKELSLDEPHVIISITDPPPFGGPATFPQRWGQLAVGRWQFADVHEEHPLAMQPEHAREIWAFVEKWRADAAVIVVHCEAGASRSPSIAMAIADRLRIKRDCIDWLRFEHVAGDSPPNDLVYGLMMSVEWEGTAAPVIGPNRKCVCDRCRHVALAAAGEMPRWWNRLRVPGDIHGEHVIDICGACSAIAWAALAPTPSGDTRGSGEATHGE